MKNKKRLVGIGAVSVALLVTLWGQSEWKVRQLSQPQAHLNARPVSPQLRAAWPAQNQQLAQLWLARQQRDVTPELLQLLQSSQHPDIRRRTVRALGRLEKSATLAPLQTWQKTLTPAEQEALSPTLPLAIGRIQSHDLIGQKKLDAVAKSVGLSWGEIVRLSQKVNAPKAYAQGTPADQIVDEIVDVLYSMGRKDVSVRELSGMLTIPQPQKLMIESSSLPKSQEFEVEINYLSRIEILNGPNYELIDHLRSFSPDSAKVAISRLTEMKRNPNSYPKKVNYKALFIVATGNNYSPSVSVLKQFEQSSNAYWSQKARIMRLRVEANQAIPIVPS